MGKELSTVLKPRQIPKYHLCVWLEKGRGHLSTGTTLGINSITVRLQAETETIREFEHLKPYMDA